MEAGTDQSGDPDRRQMMKTAAAGMLAAGTNALDGRASAGDGTPPFLPESAWKERMNAPDDGKRYAWLVDTRRCFGCHACEVACKAENDVPLGHYIRQTLYHDHAKPGGGMARIMVPMACQHCEDAPCVKACPCGALHKGAGGSVQVNYDTCSGHGACQDVCPYGAIYIDPVANQAIKCHNCTHRIDVGLEPACVATCPSEALVFGDLNDEASKISRLTALLGQQNLLEMLRPEKGTQPRTQFVVDAEHAVSLWEGKVPREGQSYSPNAYSVYAWGEPGVAPPLDAAPTRGGKAEHASPPVATPTRGGKAEHASPPVATPPLGESSVPAPTHTDVPEAGR